VTTPSKDDNRHPNCPQWAIDAILLVQVYFWRTGSPKLTFLSSYNKNSKYYFFLFFCSDNGYQFPVHLYSCHISPLSWHCAKIQPSKERSDNFTSVYCRVENYCLLL
jgi:hypothetical protein